VVLPEYGGPEKLRFEEKCPRGRSNAGSIMKRACVRLLFFFTACSLLPAVMRPQALGRSPFDLNTKPPENALELTPSERGLCQWAPTLIDWTPRQIKDCPVLHKLRPTANQGQLAEILKRAGETGELTFQDFPRISSNEAVTSKMGQGDLLATEHQKFQYIVIPDPSNGVKGLKEYRTTLGGAPATKFSLDDLYMLTSGFASTWLYLSPAEQRDSRFRYFGMQRIRNRECQVVAFAQEPARARRVEEVKVADGRRAALLVQGLAWIDAETYQTLRIMTWLLAPRMDLSLSTQISTVDFYPVQPIGMDRTLWLPRDVNVWAVYRGVGIRNIHRYSNFKLFRVESTIKPSP
jgi:hypothetical protein